MLIATVFHLWRLMCHYVPQSLSFGASGGLCFVIVAFPLILLVLHHITIVES